MDPWVREETQEKDTNPCISDIITSPRHSDSRMYDPAIRVSVHKLIRYYEHTNAHIMNNETEKTSFYPSFVTDCTRSYLLTSNRAAGCVILIKMAFHFNEVIKTLSDQERATRNMREKLNQYHRNTEWHKKFQIFSMDFSVSQSLSCTESHPTKDIL